ncbi:MAG TPA: hypothetical protein VJA19_20060, partial [Pseudomonas sp.]|nr:hypothetical protein [Pseudomonas sp.]
MSTLPLAKLFRQMSSAEFAPVLVERWRNGNREEVAGFFRSCDRASLEWLVDLRGEEAPWWQDFELWLALLRLTGPRALYLRCAAEIIPVSQAFSREMQAIAHALPAAHNRDALVQKNDFILRSLFDFFWYEGIAREEVLAQVDWALELRREADFAWAPQGLKPLIAELKETSDLLSLAEAGGAVCKQALEAYERRSASQPADTRWRPWHDFFTRHPELYDLHPIDDPELIAMRWQGAGAEQRRELLCRLLKTMGHASSPQWKHCQHLFDRLVRESPAVLVAVLENIYEKRL